MQQNDTVFWDLLPFPFWPSVKSLQRLLYIKYTKREKMMNKNIFMRDLILLIWNTFYFRSKAVSHQKNCSIKTLWFHPLKHAFKCIINVENWNVFFCVYKMSSWFSFSETDLVRKKNLSNSVVKNIKRNVNSWQYES